MSVFKANDIRGSCPNELTPGMGCRVGLHLPGVLGANRIPVGRDARVSSEAVFKQLVDGIRISGPGASRIGPETGLHELERSISGRSPTARNRGLLEDLDIRNDYRHHAQQFTGDVSGVLFDGDADRVVFFEVCSSRSVAEYIAGIGGEALACPTGHARIKDMLRHSGGTYADELSGHNYFRENYCCNSGFIAAAVVISVVKNLGEPLSRTFPIAICGRTSTRPSAMGRSTTARSSGDTQLTDGASRRISRRGHPSTP